MSHDPHAVALALFENAPSFTTFTYAVQIAARQIVRDDYQIRLELALAERRDGLERCRAIRRVGAFAAG